MSLLVEMFNLTEELPWFCDTRLSVGPDGRGVACVEDRFTGIRYGSIDLDLDPESGEYLGDEAQVMRRLRESVWERAATHGRRDALGEWRP